MSNTLKSGSAKSGARHSASDQQHMNKAMAHMAAAGAQMPMDQGKTARRLQARLKAFVRDYADAPNIKQLAGYALQETFDIQAAAAVLNLLSQIAGSETMQQEPDDVAEIGALIRGLLVFIQGEADEMVAAMQEPDGSLPYEVAVDAGLIDGTDEDEMTKSTPADFLISFGDAVKAVSDNEIEGLLVRWGNPDEPDLSELRDYFTPQTYLGKHAGAGAEVTLNHGIPLKAGLEWAADQLIGEIKSTTVTQYGLLARAIIEADEQYKAVIMDMVKQGRLRWSSGALSHLVKRTPMPNGTHRIDQWIIGEGALTPTPAEPRLAPVQSIKTYAANYQSNSTDDPKADTPKADAGVLAERNAPVASAAAVTETEPDPGLNHTDADATKVAPPTPTPNGSGQVLENDEMDAELTQALKDMATAQTALATAQAETAKQLGELKSMWNAPADNAGGQLASKGGQAPAHNRTPLGDDPFQALGWYIKTGDPGGIRTGDAYNAMVSERNSMKTTYNLLESTQYQGQEAVPTEVVAKIIEKRDQISVLRAAGAQTLPVGSNAVVLPIEKASPEKFVITTVDGTNTFDRTTVQPMDKLSGTIYLFTKEVPIDMQLLDDSVFGIEQWWSRRMARAWGLTENYYFLIGSNSGQPQGVINGATSAFTSASGLALTSSEIVKLYYSVNQEYRDNLNWVMSGATEATVRQLGAPTYGFAFTGNGGFNGGAGAGAGATGRWMVDPASRVFNGSDMAAIGVNNKPIAVFNAEAGYVIFERKGLTIFRDPYTLAAKGEIDILAYFRETGGVANSDAMKYVTMASA